METKKWWLSKGIWGSIVAILAVILSYAGMELDEETQNLFIDQAYAIAVAVTGLVGGILALVGRAKADKRVTK